MNVKGKGRLARDLALPVVLLLAIGVWFWLSQPRAAAPATLAPAQSTPSAAGTSLAATPEARGLEGLATPWAVAGAPGEATAAPTPTAVPGAPEPIALLGPPAGSLFRRADTVSFYWQWPGELAAEQRFVVYIAAAGQPVALAEVVEANLGAVFQAQAPAGSMVDEATQYQWWVILEDEATGTTIGQSAPRTIGFTGG